jgi:uncharacterized protein
MCTASPKEEDLLEWLDQRIGRSDALQRLSMERDYEDKFNGRFNFFHPDKWYSLPSILTYALKLTGLYRVGSKNAERIQIRHNHITSRDLPRAFNRFTILHITDLHVETNPGAIQRMIKLVEDLKFDICVLTGDFRARVFGPFDAALSVMERMRSQLGERVYAVLGNYDSVGMLPALEMMGIRVLFNESEPIVRGSQKLHLAGVDDAHYYRSADVQKAAAGIPGDEFAILLSHTPEIYRQAAEAGFKLLLSGHTHGGQVCLPGSIPITLSSHVPRRLGAGPWTYQGMAGYTSVGVGCSAVCVRFHCPPEITLHHLHSIA